MNLVIKSFDVQYLLIMIGVLYLYCLERYTLLIGDDLEQLEKFLELQWQDL